MKQFVIDTSVFMKLFLEEEDSEKAVAFFVQVNDNNYSLIIPALFQLEFLNVVKNKSIDFEEAYGLLEAYFATSLTQIEYSRAIMEKALEIAKQGDEKPGDLSVYDSIYHALAILNDCDFITADKRYYEIARKLGNIKLLSAVVGG